MEWLSLETWTALETLEPPWKLWKHIGSFVDLQTIVSSAYKYRFVDLL